ncbi:hypothetical protein QFC21_005705 [Naganishia friedmannii]|uniref:Uncharacterized protein n=1 Tax=Naganishia friedmannii TaxID=89922 RepID=A0ACC2V8N7_9TREE|nr:hypothetical protein QFC21_005705 [Naganishia friedmannii]
MHKEEETTSHEVVVEEVDDEDAAPARSVVSRSRPHTLLVASPRPASTHTTHPEPLAFPALKTGDNNALGFDMASLAIPRLAPAAGSASGHQKGHGKHRRSLHATVTIPVQPAPVPPPAVVQPTAPSPAPVAATIHVEQPHSHSHSHSPPPVPVLVESHYHTHSRHPTPEPQPDVEIDLSNGSHDVLIHTHSQAHPHPPEPTPQLGHRRSSSTIRVKQQQPQQAQTVVEVFPAHTEPIHHHHQTKQSTRSPTPPPLLVAPATIIPHQTRIPHHTHRFPHLPEPTSVSSLAGEGIGEMMAGIALDEAIKQDNLRRRSVDSVQLEQVDARRAGAGRLNRFSDIQPIPINYTARVEKDRLQKEKEAERLQAKMTAATGGFPGMMLPGPLGMGMMARPLPGGTMMPPIGIRPPLMPGGMLGFRPPLLCMGMGMGMGGMPFGGGGMLGAFNPNALPGRFGRDVLGRDFAGPGGLGASSNPAFRVLMLPYRPPDPGNLRPMPQGLPIVARPPKEGFDAYGRPIPPPVPEGFDGWGRPLPGGPNGMFPMRPPGMPFPIGNLGQTSMQPGPERTPSPQLEMSHHHHDHRSHSDPGRPEDNGENERSADSVTLPSYVVYPCRNRPPMFRRPPSNDEKYHYGDFDSFAFSAARLDRPDRLRRPYPLKDHDVRQDEWAYFIESLSSEAFRHQQRSQSDSHSHSHPRLTKDVQDLLRAWQHGYFGPRAVQVYIAKGGKKVYDHGYGVPFHRAAMSMHDGRSVYTDTTTRYRDIAHSDGQSSDEGSENTYDSHEEARFSARERAHRREKRRRRARERREERKAAKHGIVSGEWEVHFEYTAPTVHGVKSVKYGEKLPYERPS